MKGLSSIVDVLEYRASLNPGKFAFSHIDLDGNAHPISYAQLRTRAARVAATIVRHTEVGDRVVIMLEGLDFVVAFLGCAYSGRVPVPLAPARGARTGSFESARQIAGHCGAKLALVDSVVKDRAERLGVTGIFGLPGGCIRSDQLDGPDVLAAPIATEIAFIQYTSGSTGAPKGVVVRHASLLDNVERIRSRFGYGEATIGASWLPPHHDMGLVGCILQPLYAGFHTFLLTPSHFVQRPLRWLELITRYGVNTTGGPTFAYDQCVRRITPRDVEQLDLRSWNLAFIGAEMLRQDVMKAFCNHFAAAGFDGRAFAPCYGMAEGTLMLSGRAPWGGYDFAAVDKTELALGRLRKAPAESSEATSLAYCGPVVSGHAMLIVDPNTCTPLGPNGVGEVWVRGPSIAAGYYADEAETDRVFHAKLNDDDGYRYLRTGDRGFLQDGELVVCGRLKTLVIIRGQNYSPEVLEEAVEASHEALLPHGTAAFSVVEPSGEGLVVVCEVQRAWVRWGDGSGIVAAIQRSLGINHGLRAADVVLVKPGAVPRTTSGKVKRLDCQRLYLEGALAAVGVGRSITPESPERSTSLV